MRPTAEAAAFLLRHFFKELRKYILRIKTFTNGALIVLERIIVESVHSVQLGIVAIDFRIPDKPIQQTILVVDPFLLARLA